MPQGEKLLLIGLFILLVFRSFVRTEVTATIRDFELVPDTEGKVSGPFPAVIN